MRREEICIANEGRGRINRICIHSSLQGRGKACDEAAGEDSLVDRLNACLAIADAREAPLRRWARALPKEDLKSGDEGQDSLVRDDASEQRGAQGIDDGRGG